MSMVISVMLLEVTLRMYSWWWQAADTSPSLRAALGVAPAYLTLMLYIALLGAAWSILGRKSVIDHVGYIIATVALLDHVLSNGEAYDAIIGAPDGVTALGYAIALASNGIAPLALCFMPIAAAARGWRGR